MIIIRYSITLDTKILIKDVIIMFKNMQINGKYLIKRNQKLRNFSKFTNLNFNYFFK